MKKYYKIRFALLMLLSVLAFAPVTGQTFEKTISVTGALRLLPTRGVQIKSSYSGSGSVTVKMNGVNEEIAYTCGAPVLTFIPVFNLLSDGWPVITSNVLLYQTTVDNANRGSLDQGTGVDGTVFNTESFSACEQTRYYAFGPRIKTNESIHYKRNIRTYNYLKNGAYQPFHRVFGYTVPVTIEVTFTGGMNMSHIDKFNLPGLGDITPAELQTAVSYSGDFSDLFTEDLTIAAHRGTWEEAGTAQNSIGSIENTRNAGVDHIELDIRSTRDFHPILFHDDSPQSLLQGIPSGFTLATTDHLGNPVTLNRDQIGTYDFLWEDMKDYKLYDRFDNETTETVVDLETALDYIIVSNFTLPINMDLGIPSFGGEVPQGGEKVEGQPFYERIFLEMIRLGCEKGLTDQMIFKAKFPWDHPIWVEVRAVLNTFANGSGVAPKIAYIPKGGDELQEPPSNPSQTIAGYYNDWFDVQNGTKNIPGIEVVGVEPRIKTSASNANNTALDNVISTAKSRGMAVGVFSESTTSCQGYWTKSASEKYVNFQNDFRNDFEWVIDKGYNYIITEYAQSLVSFKNKSNDSFGSRTLTQNRVNLNEQNVIDRGFTIGFSLNMKDYLTGTGVVWLAELNDAINRSFFKVGINKDNGHIFYRRWVDNGSSGVPFFTNDFRYDITFWQPPATNYVDYVGTNDNKRVKFYIVVEPEEIRLHVAMPDGKFDCMYLDGGLKGTQFEREEASGINQLRMEFGPTSLVQNTYVNQRAMCRTDVYKHAIDTYFSQAGITQLSDAQSFSLLNHDNPYFTNKRDAVNDKEVNDQDNSRIYLGCQYFQGSGNFPSARLALEEASDLEDETIPESFSYYPNPNEGIINLNIGDVSEEPDQATLQLFDLAGKLEASRIVEITAGQSEVVWDVRENNNLPTGMYVLKVQTDAGIYSGRIIMDCGCGN